MLTRHGDIKSSCQIRGVMYSRHSRFHSSVKFNVHIFRCHNIHDWIYTKFKGFTGHLCFNIPWVLLQNLWRRFKRLKALWLYRFIAKIKTLYKLGRNITKFSRTYFMFWCILIFSGVLSVIFHISSKGSVHIVYIIYHWHRKVEMDGDFKSLTVLENVTESVFYANSDRKTLMAFPF